MPLPPQGHGLRYAPGLDGVRALAVFAVVAYHIGTTSSSTVLPGGFLGVDVFFVLSGYLITSLLIVEVQQTGRISIKNFYIRRARRLLPALFALLLIVAAIGAFWLPQQAARLKGDLLASLGYVTNWWLIAEDSSYFGNSGDRPPLLTHLWSLAVEEQYYLAWPLILMAFAAVRARRGLMLTIVGAGILGSMVVGYQLYDPLLDPSRVYYGTDTRALAPLLGAFLAIAVKPWHHRPRLPRGTRHGLDFLGVTALLALAAVAAILHDTDELLYRGGFLVIAVLGGIVVTVAGHPGTALGEALGTQPLRYLGERSYAIYLWHWPVCLLTRPGIDVPLTGWANAAARIAAAIVLAEISYQLIERPIRKHGFIAALRRPRTTKAAAPSAAGLRPVRPGQPAPDVRETAAPRRPRAALAYTAVLSVTLVAGGTWAGIGLTAAASRDLGLGFDVGEQQSLGPLPTASLSTGPSAPPHPSLARGATVAFFGDSQALTLLYEPVRPVDLSTYINAVDASMEGCGLLLGRVDSRSGEWRNLDYDWCRGWQSTWAEQANQHDPAVAVIMLGAWDVFDLKLPGTGQNLPFGSVEWDQNFRVALTQAISILRAPDRFVALSLLPCFRPDPSRQGSGAGYWPERGDDDRTRHINDLLLEAAEKDPSGVITLQPPGEFCTEPIASNRSYRWDGVHYATRGAELYFSTILPQIMAPEALQDPSATPSTTPSPGPSNG